jgi:DNA-binding transcriptional regulator YdaS (Cro superfamily)
MTMADPNSNPEETAISRAIRLAHGQSALARKFNPPISSQAVQQWEANGQAPADRCLDIERFVNRKVTRYDLRPDVFGNPPRSKRVA